MSLVERSEPDLPIAAQCRLLKVARSTLYYRPLPVSVDDLRLMRWLDEQFLKTPLKGQKDEFDYMGTVAQPCVPSLFPHWSETPCWWLERHKVQWISS